MPPVERFRCLWQLFSDIYAPPRAESPAELPHRTCLPVAESLAGWACPGPHRAVVRPPSPVQKARACQLLVQNHYPERRRRISPGYLRLSRWTGPRSCAHPHDPWYKRSNPMSWTWPPLVSGPFPAMQPAPLGYSNLWRVRTAPCAMTGVETNWVMGRSAGRAIIIWPLVCRPDRHELKAKFLDSVEEPVQVRLIDHAAGQHRGARDPVHLHSLRQETKRFAQFAAEDQPVRSASCSVAVLKITVTLRQVTCHHLLAVPPR